MNIEGYEKQEQNSSHIKAFVFFKKEILVLDWGQRKGVGILKR